MLAWRLNALCDRDREWQRLGGIVDWLVVCWCHVWVYPALQDTIDSVPFSLLSCCENCNKRPVLAVSDKVLPNERRNPTSDSPPL